MMFMFREKNLWGLGYLLHGIEQCRKKGHGKLYREIISSFFERKISKHKIFSKYMA